jgi:hypothetical protein
MAEQNNRERINQPDGVSIHQVFWFMIIPNWSTGKEISI